MGREALASGLEVALPDKWRPLLRLNPNAVVHSASEALLATWAPFRRLD